MKDDQEVGGIFRKEIGDHVILLYISELSNIYYTAYAVPRLVNGSKWEHAEKRSSRVERQVKTRLGFDLYSSYNLQQPSTEHSQGGYGFDKSVNTIYDTIGLFMHHLAIATEYCSEFSLENEVFKQGFSSGQIVGVFPRFCCGCCWISVAAAMAPSRLRAIGKIGFSRNLAELRWAKAATWLSCDFDYESVKLVQFHILLQSNKIRFKLFLDVQTKASSRPWQWHQV